MLQACSGGKAKNGDSESARKYFHPTTSGGGTSTTRKSDMVTGVATEDTSISFGTSVVTVKSGTYSVPYNLIMTNYGGGFLESDDVRLISEAVKLQITSDDKTLVRDDAAFDIQVEISSLKGSLEKNLVVLLRENSDASLTQENKILRNSVIATEIVALEKGLFKATFRVRSPDIAFVLATSSVDAPSGYSDFDAPPKAATDLVGTALSLNDVELAFKSKPLKTTRFAVTYSNSGAAPVCTEADVVSPAETPEKLTVSQILAGVVKTGLSSYKLTIPKLVGGTTYKFRLCAFNGRTPADFSRPAVTTEVQMPEPVSATLTGTPSNPSAASALSVTVAGTNVSVYKYALRQGVDAGSCVGATYSDWTLVATPISNSLPADEAYLLCVLGKFSETNYQINPTSHSWTKIQNPIFTSIDLINAAADLILTSADRALTTAIVGNIIGTSYDSVGYVIAANATTCDGALTYSPTVTAANGAGITADGSYKVCVKLFNTVGGPIAYGASSAFTVDTTPPVFTSLTLINDAADGIVSLAERPNATALAGSLMASGSVSEGYKLVASAVACNAILVYGGSIPASNSGDFGLDGTYKICVSLTDAVGNVSFGASAVFALNVNPVFTSIDLLNVAADGYINIADRGSATAVAGNLVATQYDAVGYVSALTAVTCNGALTYVGSPALANSGDFAADGAYKTCIRLSNSGGGVTVYAQSASIEVDSTAPAFVSLALANDAADGTVNLAERSNSTTMAGAITGSGYDLAAYVLVADVVTCDNLLTYGAAPASNSGAFGADGNYKICIKLSDNAGNTPVYGGSAVFALLTVAPTFTSIDTINDALDGFINIADSANTATLVGNLIASGQSSTDYILVPDATSCAGPLGYSGSIPQSNSGSFGADGLYKVCVRLGNASGNFAYGSSSSFTLDKTAPVFTSIALANDAADSYINSTESSNATNLVATLVASGQSVTEYVLVSNATACSAAGSYAGAMPMASSAVFIADGAYKVCVKLVDVAGNATFGASSVITLDKTAPVFTSLPLANETADGFISAADTGLGNAVVGSLTASGYSALHYALATNAQACTNGALSWIASSPLSNSASFGADGTYKVCARMVDAANNTTYGTSPTFVLDTLAPTFTSIPLANAASDNKIHYADYQLTTDIVGSVVGSNYDSVGYKVVQSALTCIVQTGYSPTVPKANDSAFSVNGTYKVCVELTDNGGNTPAYGNTGVISVDITLPTSVITTSGSLNPNSTVGATTVISGTAADNNAVTLVEISVQRGAGSCLNTGKTDFDQACPFYISAAGTTSWTFTLNDAMFLKGETYNLSVRSRDNFLNYQSPVSTGSISWTATEGLDLWNSTYSFNSVGTANDETRASATDSNGSLYVGGYITSAGKDWRIKKFSRYGIEITTGWNKTYSYGAGNDVVNAMAVDSSDNLYVVGSIHNGIDLDWHLKKYDSAGTAVGWDLTVDGGTGDDEALAVAIDSSNNVFVAGYGTDVDLAGLTMTDWWVKKYNSAGAEQCQIALDIGGDSDDERVQSLVIDNAGGAFYVVGWETVFGTVGWRIGKYSLANCAYINDIAVSWGSPDKPVAAALDSSGNLYIAGSTTVVGTDWRLQKYTSALVSSCSYYNNDTGSNEPQALVIDSTNNIYVGGYRNSTGTNESMWIRQFTSTCTEDVANWNKIVDVNANKDRVTSLALGRGAGDLDNLYVVGIATHLVTGTSGADWWMRKYSRP